ncbi:DUF6049 family protein [Isoptericola sp. b441]|uniref:DUF6049 family protein n=1 Tax=Actinotalea lenta TaxID=3064654 RepID=A0ABT9D5W3_9CELL|nr:MULTISPECIES: DUF6049 family protein [unclassified Isoptericola]MDO8106190.1 DUF6049 family protein [Isoptericola sp. b441]MDO8122091.1 DUF6049 family protein [Isoptericola sp. b490]
MTTPRRRAGGAAAALATALLALATLLAPPAALPARATVPSGTDAPSEVAVAVTSIDPTVLRPGDDLTLGVQVTNEGGTVVQQPRVLVHLRSRGFISRSSLDLWRQDGFYGDLGSTVLIQDLDQPLAPGQSASATLTVPAASVTLPHRAFDWGARGVGVEVVDAADPTRIRLGVARTFTVWFPRDQVGPTVVSVLVPITGPAPGPQADARVADLTAPGGRLSDVLAATADQPDVSWALDPWLLQVAARGSPAPSEIEVTPGPSASPSGAASATPSAGSSVGPAPPAAQGAAPAWGQDVLSDATGREVALLPWADADVAALVHDGATTLLDAAERRSRSTAADLGLPGGTDLLLPGDALPDLATAGWAAAHDQSLVVGPGQMPYPPFLTYTPSGRADVATARGDAHVLIPDARLSRALTTGLVLGSDTHVTAATAVADMLAELAVITRERPADSRTMLVVTPRDWDPEVDVARAQLAALADTPWVQLAPLSALADVQPSADRGTLPDRSTATGEVPGTLLSRMSSTLDRRQALAAIVPDPSRLLGDVEAERLAPTSLAWRSDPAGREALVAAAEARTATLAGAVTVPKSDAVNLLASSGEVPLRVANALAQPVTVDVRLRPSDARLVARQAVRVEVPANGEATVQIPVHGVQTADVRAAVELRTPDGVLLDDSTVVTVRVRAEWETIGTAVVGVLLAIGLVLGLVRTIRRGRGRRRAAGLTPDGSPSDADAVPEPDPAAAPPAPEDAR